MRHVYIANITSCWLVIFSHIAKLEIVTEYLYEMTTIADLIFGYISMILSVLTKNKTL